MALSAIHEKNLLKICAFRQKFTLIIFLRGDSALYRGICLWNNVLPFTAKSSFSIGTFKREAKRFLTTTDSSNPIQPYSSSSSALLLLNTYMS
jgi:hypothetical protein